jgi:hypothetical protein
VSEVELKLDSPEKTAELKPEDLKLGGESKDDESMNIEGKGDKQE